MVYQLLPRAVFWLYNKSHKQFNSYFHSLFI